MKKLLLLLILVSTIGISFAGVKRLDKDEAQIVTDLNQEGFKLDKTSEIVLNQKMNKQKLPIGSYYQIAYACNHQEKEDKCRLVSIKTKKLNKK